MATRKRPSGTNASSSVCWAAATARSLPTTTRIPSRIEVTGPPAGLAARLTALAIPAESASRYHERLNREINRVLQLPEVRERFEAQGFESVFIAELKSKAPDILGAVRDDLEIKPETEKKLRAFLDGFVQSFV